MDSGSTGELNSSGGPLGGAGGIDSEFRVHVVSLLGVVMCAGLSDHLFGGRVQ